MVQVVSMERLLPMNKIIECLELLGTDYFSLDIIIEIHSRNSLKAERNSKQLELKKKEYDLMLSPKEGAKVPKGVYVPDLRKIKMFPFTILRSDYDKLFPNGSDLKYEAMVQYMTISQLYHEIRHAWQHHHNSEIFSKEQEINDLTTDFEIYQNLETEKDADQFDREQSMKYAARLREIFGVNSTKFPMFPKYGEM